MLVFAAPHFRWWLVWVVRGRCGSDIKMGLAVAARRDRWGFVGGLGALPVNKFTTKLNNLPGIDNKNIAM
jgi:hypothetical protein